MGTQAPKKSSGVAFQSQETIRQRAAHKRCQVPALKARGEIGELQTPGATLFDFTCPRQAGAVLGLSCVSPPRSSNANSLWRLELAEPRRVIAHLKYMADARILEIAVGTLITERPPHRTVRAQFGHTAPTLGV